MLISDVASFVHDILTDVGIPLLEYPEKVSSAIDRMNLSFTPRIFVVQRSGIFYLGIDLLKRDALRLPLDSNRYNEDLVVTLIQSWVKFVLEEQNNPPIDKK